MKSNKPILLFFIAVLHVLIGYFLTSRGLSKGFNFLLLFVAVISIYKSKNKNEEAMLWSAYVVGSEVLFRMTKGLVFYEFPKYMVLLFLVTGLFVEKRRLPIPPVYLIYLLLLLFGISFSDIPYPESLRTNIIFNLSGPVLLGVCALYFYYREISISVLLNAFYYLSLPIISMVSYLYFKTPDLERISFTSNSNFSVTAGFGPNQVSTILGLGIFVLFVMVVYRKRITGYYALDIFLVVYVSYRTLLTLSRGGLITAILAIAIFSFYFILSRRNRSKVLLQFGIMFLLFGVSIWLYTSSVTRGMLDNRYANKATDGSDREDVTTGRVVLLIDEWENFLESPFFGIGVGTSKFKRYNELNIKIPSHSETTRLLGEHGLIGVILLLLLIVVPIVKMNKQSLSNKAFLSAFLVFWFLTINHSAMRLAMPAFVYGLAVMNITSKRDLVLVEVKTNE